MNIVQLILILINLLKNLQGSKTEEEFMATSSAQIGDGRFGKWLWENREELLKFILTIIGIIGGTQPGPPSQDVEAQIQELAK